MLFFKQSKAVNNIREHKKPYKQFSIWVVTIFNQFVSIHIVTSIPVRMIETGEPKGFTDPIWWI